MEMQFPGSEILHPCGFGGLRTSLTLPEGKMETYISIHSSNSVPSSLTNAVLQSFLAASCNEKRPTSYSGGASCQNSAAGWNGSFPSGFEINMTSPFTLTLMKCLILLSLF